MDNYKNSSLPVEDRINDLLSKMTVKEKVGQLTQTPMITGELDKIKDMAKEGTLGSLILCQTAFAGNDKQEMVLVKNLNEIQRIAMEESRLAIPIINGRDVIHGHHIVFPIPLAQAASWDMPLIEDAAAVAAKESSWDGVHWTFAPMLDVSRDSRWGRMIESPGEDPYLGGQMARACVKGFQGEDMSKAGKIAACAKHYIGYGAGEGGRDYHKCEITDYTLRNIYLTAFKEAVDAGVATVMSSFNEIGGQPTNSSKYLMTDLLKKELGFDGFIVSDWGAVMELETKGVAESRKECAKLALNAGIDMDMCDNCYLDHVEELVTEGELDIRILDEAVRRVLAIKFQLGLFDAPYTPVIEPTRSVEDLQTCRSLAAASMVLLKNKGNILPLKKGIKIAVVGPMVSEQRSLLGSWSLNGSKDDVVSLETGIRNGDYPNEILFCGSHCIDEMQRAVRKADLIVLALGESKDVTGEAHSLANTILPDGQEQLIQKLHSFGKPMVAVLFCGRPVALGNVEPYLDAILYAWHPGVEAGNATADILFGKTVPSGKTPVTFPRVTGQLPMYYNVPDTGKGVEGYYNKETIALNYEDCLGTPLYPFGYGLSYTEFAYSGVNISTTEIAHDVLMQGGNVNACVEITNTGDYDGYEVVQCYIHDVKSSMTRPMKELKGFRKVFIKKGETVRVEFEIGKKQLEFYNAERVLVVEKGDFEIYIGGNCYADGMQVVRVV